MLQQGGCGRHVGVRIATATALELCVTQQRGSGFSREVKLLFQRPAGAEARPQVPSAGWPAALRLASCLRIATAPPAVPREQGVPAKHTWAGSRMWSPPAEGWPGGSGSQSWWCTCCVVGTARAAWPARCCRGWRWGPEGRKSHGQRGGLVNPALPVVPALPAASPPIRNSHLWKALPHPAALEGRVRHFGATPGLASTWAADTPRCRLLTSTPRLLGR